jgi:hypothetical protein
MMQRHLWGRPAVLALAALACGPTPDADPADVPTAEPAREETRGATATASAERALRETIDRSTAAAAAVEDALRPVPLLRPAEEARTPDPPKRGPRGPRPCTGRAAGRRGGDPRPGGRGRLIELDPSNEYWIVREQAQRGLSSPLTSRRCWSASPSGSRRDWPRRTSRPTAWRSRRCCGRPRTRPRCDAQPQRRGGRQLPRVRDHPRHRVRILRAAAPDPRRPGRRGVRRDGGRAGAVAAMALEVGARKSREMQAFLGHVLIELQAAGDVLVILERLQPVYHITVGRRLAGD